MFLADKTKDASIGELTIEEVVLSRYVLIAAFKVTFRLDIDLGDTLICEGFEVLSHRS